MRYRSLLAAFFLGLGIMIGGGPALLGEAPRCIAATPTMTSVRTCIDRIIGSARQSRAMPAGLALAAAGFAVLLLPRRREGQEVVC